MAYIATKKVNTAFGSFEKGDIVSDVLGVQYSQFEKVEEAPKKEVKKAPKKEPKKEEPKVEILTEVSEPVDVTVED